MTSCVKGHSSHSACNKYIEYTPLQKKIADDELILLIEILQKKGIEHSIVDDMIKDYGNSRKETKRCMNDS